MTRIDPRASLALGLQARLDGGQAVSLSETNWDVSGRCERPQRVTVEGRQYENHTFDPHWGWVRPSGVSVDGTQKWTSVEGMVRGHATHLDVRCGKCAPCLWARRKEWTIRARTECERAARTWFITLTANSTEQLRWSSEAAERLRRGGTNPTTLSEDDWYAERCKQAGKDLTKYVKRLRRKAGNGLRALWVFEKHMGHGEHHGLPHIHGLLHESAEVSVNYRTLRSEWGCGFGTWKLLTNEAESPDKVAAYVSKCCSYLTKATAVRIRASRHYGAPLNVLAQRKRPQGIASAEGGGVSLGVSPERDESGLAPNDANFTGQEAHASPVGLRPEVRPAERQPESVSYSYRTQTKGW